MCWCCVKGDEIIKFYNWSFPFNVVSLCIFELLLKLLRLLHGSPVLANCGFTSPTTSNLQSKNQLLSQADPYFISSIITGAQSSSYNLEMKLQFFRAHYQLSYKVCLIFPLRIFQESEGKHLEELWCMSTWVYTQGNEKTLFVASTLTSLQTCTTTMMLTTPIHLMNHLHNTVYLFYNFGGRLFFLHGELTHWISSLQWKKRNSLHTAVWFLPVNCKFVLLLALLLQHPSCYSLFGWC